MATTLWLRGLLPYMGMTPKREQDVKIEMILYSYTIKHFLNYYLLMPIGFPIPLHPCVWPRGLTNFPSQPTEPNALPADIC